MEFQIRHDGGGLQTHQEFGVAFAEFMKDGWWKLSFTIGKERYRIVKNPDGSGNVAITRFDTKIGNYAMARTSAFEPEEPCAHAPCNGATASYGVKCKCSGCETCNADGKIA